MTEYLVYPEQNDNTLLLKNSLSVVDIRSTYSRWSSPTFDITALPNTYYFIRRILDQDYLPHKIPLHQNVDFSNFHYHSQYNNLAECITRDVSDIFQYTDKDLLDNILNKISSSSYFDVTKLPAVLNYNVSNDKNYSYSDVITQSVEYNNSLLLNSSSSIYPHCVRYISSSGRHYIERPPFKAVVDFKSAKASSNKNPIPKCEVWIPWTLTEINVFNGNPTSSGVRIHYSYEPLSSSMDTKYLRSFFPNSYNDGTICYSNSLSELDIESQDLNYLYSMIINEYFSGGWNLDLGIPILSHVMNFDNANDFSDITREYRKPTPSSLRKRFPGINNSEISNLISQSRSYVHSTHSLYFFKMMSSMTLEETLDFVKDIATDSISSIIPEPSLDLGREELFSKAFSSRFNSHHIFLNHISESQRLQCNVTAVVFNHNLPIPCGTYTRPVIDQVKNIVFKSIPEISYDNSDKNIFVNYQDSSYHIPSEKFDYKRFFMEILYEECFSSEEKEISL